MVEQNQALISRHVYTWLNGCFYWLYFLNPVFGSNATQRPKTRAALTELKEIEIEMPELDYSTFDVLLEKGLPYSAATEENGFPYGDFLLVDGFLDQAKPELNLAADYLGLSILSPVAQ